MSRKEQSDLLITEEVVERLGVSEPTLVRWRQEGVGPRWCKLGRSVRYRRSAIDEYIAENERPVRKAG